MTDYTKLVKELRGCKYIDYCTDCPRMAANGYVEICNIKDDAAAAIEDLQAELEKKRTSDCWGCKCEKMEASVRLQKRGKPVLLAALPTASPWHRVEEEMPDLLQFVVVCNDEGKCVVAQYVGYQTDSLTSWRIAYTMYDTDIYDETECGPVRYWMPIEPPKEDA